MSVLELGRLRVRRSAKQPKAERVFGRGGLVYVGVVVTMVAQHSVAGTVLGDRSACRPMRARTGPALECWNLLPGDYDGGVGPKTNHVARRAITHRARHKSCRNGLTRMLNVQSCKMERQMRKPINSLYCKTSPLDAAATI